MAVEPRAQGALLDRVKVRVIETKRGPEVWLDIDHAGYILGPLDFTTRPALDWYACAVGLPEGPGPWRFRCVVQGCKKRWILEIRFNRKAFLTDADVSDFYVCADHFPGPGFSFDYLCTLAEGKTTPCEPS